MEIMQVVSDLVATRRVPGSRERTVERCQRIKAAIESRYSELARQGLLVSGMTVQDKQPGSPIELIGTSGTESFAGH